MKRENSTRVRKGRDFSGVILLVSLNELETSLGYEILKQPQRISPGACLDFLD